MGKVRLPGKEGTEQCYQRSQVSTQTFVGRREVGRMDQDSGVVRPKVQGQIRPFRVLVDRMRGGAAGGSSSLGWSKPVSLDRQVGVERSWDLNRETLAGQLPRGCGPEGFLEASEKV